MLEKGIKQRRLTAALLVLLMLICLPLAAWAEAGEIQQITLSWTQDPRTSQSFSWQAPVGASVYVQVAETAAFSNPWEEAGSATEVRVSSPGYYRYEATVGGLQADHGYYYRIGSDALSWSETRSFQTAPAASLDGATFLYLGDVQVQDDMEAELNAWGALVQAAYARNDAIAFGVIGGDLVQSGLDLDNWQHLLEKAESVFSRIPLLPANGNHESNYADGKPQSYVDMFALPQNGPSGFAEEFYSFDYGNCHITVLNSHVYSGEQNLSEQDYERIKDWLRQDLNGSRLQWRIVVLHHPPYAVAADSVSALVKENWVPIFEQAQVDLALVGHQHVYSRSYPLYENQRDYINGIVYVMGVSGSKFYSTANEQYSAKTIYNTSNYQVVSTDEEYLNLISYDAAGRILDSFSIMAKERALPAAGDINGDGLIDAADVRLVIEAILLADDSDPNLDVNADGAIDIRDAQEILLLYL